MIILGVTIENRNAFRGMGVRFAAATKNSLRETALYWHQEIFDSHFTPGNNSRYPMASRNPFYLSEIKMKAGKGQGKYVLLKLSERSQRWMRAFVNVTGTSSVQTVRMRPTIYFANPFIGDITDPKTGKVKHVTKQPDKPAEATTVNDNDREKLKRFMQGRLQQAVRNMVYLAQFSKN